MIDSILNFVIVFIAAMSAILLIAALILIAIVFYASGSAQAPRRKIKPRAAPRDL